MWVTRSGPSSLLNPVVSVDFPAALSPTIPRTIGLLLFMLPSLPLLSHFAIFLKVRFAGLSPLVFKSGSRSLQQFRLPLPSLLERRGSGECRLRQCEQAPPWEQSRPKPPAGRLGAA